MQRSVLYTAAEEWSFWRGQGTGTRGLDKPDKLCKRKDGQVTREGCSGQEIKLEATRAAGGDEDGQDMFLYCKGSFLVEIPRGLQSLNGKIERA